ncbi:MAG: hypothetical protein QXZ63_06670 [Sulfolobales archaeon]
MKVGEYVRRLNEAGVHVCEATVMKIVEDMLAVLSNEELNLLLRHAVIEGDDWLAQRVTEELVLRKMRVV